MYISITAIIRPDDLLREPTNPEGTDEYPRGSFYNDN